VVFEYPKDPSKDYIKRVIGTPGDKIEIVNKQVLVNGTPYVDPHEVYKGAETGFKTHNPADNMAATVIPPGSYFVMGDNRDNSSDSRFWGFVKGEKIKGLAFIKYWSWDSPNMRVRWENIGDLID
jgi:signal peptidase I